jgi:hypothetical protein
VVESNPYSNLGNPVGRGVYLTLASESKWDTDSWNPRPPHDIGEPGKPYGSVHWSSVGGFGRGCHNEVRYKWHGSCGPPRGPFHPCEGTITFSVTYHHHGESEHSCTHTGENPRCRLGGWHRQGKVNAVKWRIIGLD